VSLEEGVPVIEAAGGVLCRDTADGLQVALVHRPKYDDWSLPKGKLERNEHPLVGALREVVEETGYTVRTGRPLGQVTYPLWGAIKRVRYWAMWVTGGAFTPNREVDTLDWLSADEALDRLDHPRDKQILDSFVADSAPTRTWMLMRHACAGERDSWSGEDRDRPLDEYGRAQAAALVSILAAYGVRRVISAEVRRCLETVAPYAHHAGLRVEIEPLIGEKGYAAAPEAAVRWLLETVRDPRPTVLCSQGGAVPEFLTRLGAVCHFSLPGEPRLDKGAYCVLHLATEGSPGRVVGIERDQPLA
jgi:8-oxo-(d)GTP phosphatase